MMQVKFNPKDSNTFASCSLDNTIKVWGLNASSPYFSLNEHKMGVNCIDYSSANDKPYLISGSDDKVSFFSRCHADGAHLGLPDEDVHPDAGGPHGERDERPLPPEAADSSDGQRGRYRSHLAQRDLQVRSIASISSLDAS